MLTILTDAVKSPPHTLVRLRTTLITRCPPPHRVTVSPLGPTLLATCAHQRSTRDTAPRSSPGPSRFLGTVTHPRALFNHRRSLPPSSHHFQRIEIDHTSPCLYSYPYPNSPHPPFLRIHKWFLPGRPAGSHATIVQISHGAPGTLDEPDSVRPSFDGRACVPAQAALSVHGCIQCIYVVLVPPRR